MNAILRATYLGIKRGGIEFRQTLTNPQDLVFNIFITIILLVILYFQRNSTMPGSDISLAMVTLASMLGMLVVIGGTIGTASQLAMEREDGTLLRAKATPHGMIGYLVSRVISTTIYTVLSLLLLVIPGLFIVNDLLATNFFDWMALLGILGLGLLATLPWGAIIGSLVKSSVAGFNISFLILGSLGSISGIFYAIAALPGWIQAIAQVFPMYWLGLGMRSALLPDTAVVIELGQSWRHFEMFSILSIWAIAGLIIAPKVLRRMAQHESGSTMQARKEQVLKRGY